MRRLAVVLAAALIVTLPGAKAADLVIWWDEGFYAEEDEAVRETIAAFEQGTGKQVELVVHPQEDLPRQIVTAIEEGRPPDFAFGLDIAQSISHWAFEDRLADLSESVGHFWDLFDPSALRGDVAHRQDRAESALRAAGRPLDQSPARSEGSVGTGGLRPR